MIIIALASLCYLIGSIPFGLLITKALGMGDIRNTGSGNIGATNVLRSGNKKAAAATLLLDALKGFLALYIARHVFHGHLASIALIAVLLGHCFPIWLQFKGGKGVATYIGAMFGVAWPIGVFACLIWAVTAKLSKISSVAGIVMVSTIPFVSYFMFGGAVFWSLLIAGLLILFQHRENLMRIANGTESRIGSK